MFVLQIHPLHDDKKHVVQPGHKKTEETDTQKMNFTVTLES